MTNILFKSSDVITNLSKYELTTDEVDILTNGLDYSIPPCKLNKTNIFYSDELICRSMLSNVVANKNDAKVRSELSHLVHLYYSNYKPSRNTIDKHKILKKLKGNEDIVIDLIKGVV